MEHDTSLEASERLAGLLGDPRISPSGRVIPPSTGELLTGKRWRMSDLNVGQQGEILAFQVDDATAAFLQNEGLEQGVQVVVEAVSSSGGILVRTKEKRVSITREIAEKITVKSSEAVKTYAI
jgi:Fe2+ transport system protein FeoA